MLRMYKKNTKKEIRRKWWMKWFMRNNVIIRASTEFLKK